MSETATTRFLGSPAIPEEPASRIDWFIRLRWFAAAGVLVFAVFGRHLLQLRFSLMPFVLISLGIGLYNLVFLVLSRRDPRQGAWGAGEFAALQVALDLLVLTVLMHFGGGIENPFAFYYLFHIIIAAILLSPWKVALLVLYASICIAGLAAAELTRLLPHRHVEGLLPVELYNNWKLVLVSVLAMVSALCVTAFLASSIAGRLHERERELEQANAVLAEQDRLKSEYVMRVAHDLAGPAGMVTSCLKLVTKGLAGPVSERVLDIVQRAERKGEYLGHLIKDLLSLSRIKAAKDMPKAGVELVEIIDQVFEDLQSRAAEKDVTLARKLPDTLPEVYGNAVAIQELLSNLATNAVKYTHLGGRVEITALNSSHEVLVEVRDDGVGIPADALPHIFEEFYRADNVKAEAVEGTGLGLAIVSHILKAHGGRIWVESDEGKGTTFAFTLPVVRNGHA